MSLDAFMFGLIMGGIFGFFIGMVAYKLSPYPYCKEHKGSYDNEAKYKRNLGSFRRKYERFQQLKITKPLINNELEK